MSLQRPVVKHISKGIRLLKPGKFFLKNIMPYFSAKYIGRVKWSRLIYGHRLLRKLDNNV